MKGAMRLFSTAGCPYAHRTRALLALLGQAVEVREVDLAAKPADFTALSPTGAVPLLEDQGFVLYESMVINEYLAERLAWTDAFASDLHQRARERLAMKRFDDLVVTTALRSLRDPGVLDATPVWRREVAQLGLTVAGSRPASLLGLHLATHWLRQDWAFAGTEAVESLRRAAGPFLDAAAALPCVTATSPDRAATVALLRARFGPAAAASQGPP
jgi:glutathione S-transferase